MKPHHVVHVHVAAISFSIGMLAALAVFVSTTANTAIAYAQEYQPAPVEQTTQTNRYFDRATMVYGSSGEQLAYHYAGL